MRCPHCGVECVKEAIQAEDLSGWYVGWMCECAYDEDHVEIVVHASKDWTASILGDARAEGAYEEGLGEGHDGEGDDTL